MRPVGSKYLLEEPLGRGATGTVWRARQRETAGAEAAVAGQPGETVAIKVLKEELANDPDVVMRFLRERSVLLRLTHPNIVRVRDLVVEGDLLALVMDLVDGPDLHRYLRENGPFTPVAAALLTAQVADALAASHADGVVHRDLKPANVLMMQNGGQMHPLLTDFGIARLADSPGLTRTSEFVGTPAYVAPESAEGRPQTSAVDIYGAGILLYELVTGRPPFSGGSALEVLHQHLNAEPRRPSTVPDPLWTVIERCLRKNPDDRPSAENLARGLRIVAEGIGVHANSLQIAAAEGVGHVLAPDPAPAAVPGGGYDPNAATSVLPHTGGPAGAADPTAVLPHTGGPQGAADPTAVLPPVPPGQYGGPAQPPEQPHPGRPRCRAPATATSRPRSSSTSTPVRTRCAAAPSGRCPASPSSRRSPTSSSGPHSVSNSAPSRRPATGIRGSRRSSSTRRPATPAAAPAVHSGAHAPAAAAPAAAGRAPAAARAPAARRQPDEDPRPGLPEGLPVHDRHPVRGRLAGLGADPAAGLDRHGAELLEAHQRLVPRHHRLDRRAGVELRRKRKRNRLTVPRAPSRP